MRWVRFVVPVVVLVVAAGCGSSESAREDTTVVRAVAEPLEPTGDRLFVGTEDGVVALDGDTGEVVFEAEGARGTPDWSRLYRTADSGQGTRFETLDPRTGDVAASFDVGGPGLEARVVSTDGRLVALAPPTEVTASGAPLGRESTDLVVVSPDGRVRYFSRAGNYEPEAFSLDGTSLVLLEYTPATAPEQYQVRRLDLASGEITDIYGPNDEAQRAMRGTARSSALAPDGRRLYTYYAVESLGTAFVHVQSLDEDWAFCLDLPAPFGEAAGAPVALTVSPDGGSLWVADLGSGSIARADTASLEVVATRALDGGGEAEHAALTVDGEHLYLASGSSVAVIDGASLEPIRRFDFGTSTATVNAGPDGRRLYVGLPTGVAVVDRDEGTELGRFPVAGVRTIAVAGAPADPIEATHIGDVQCAC
jgi:hypothetical protein